MSDVLNLGALRARDMGLERVTQGFYPADAIHELLGAGVKAYAYDLNQDHLWWTNSNDPGIKNIQAILIGIKPIVQESEERKLLREFVNLITAKIWRGDQWSIPVDYFDRYVEKANALLGEKP